MKNFNIQSGTEQEIVVNNTLTTNQTIPIAGGTGTKIEVSMVGHPNSNVSKTFVGETGWMEGLPIISEDWADGARKRWSQNTWTQDDINLTYLKNPRVTESKVGDDENNYTRKTKTEYLMQTGSTSVSEFGLVSKVEIFDTDQTTVLKKVETDYNLSNDYVSRRIIGLPSETRGYGYNQKTSTLEYVSRVTYNYDGENFSQESNQIISPFQHDTTNYGSTFIIGRGNLTSVTRWDADLPTSSSEAVTSKVRYDIAGSAVAGIDPLNRKVTTSYADNFNDGNNSRLTYAYPTTVTDPNQKSSTIKYRYDFGANVEANSPAPAGNSYGKKTTRVYDSLGRLDKESVWKGTVEYAYTRYDYPTNGMESKVYSTVSDTNNNGKGDAAEEVLAEAWTDGAGRVLKSRTKHPGSSGGFSSSLVEYDILGRVSRSTVPTEINSSWNPAGDDYRGMNGNDYIWLWTSQIYDWNGRVKEKINTDGTKQLISYDGCGCAGGQVTTIEGEEVFETDWGGTNPVSLGRRTQKVYQDILGRTWKTEVLNWDDSVYSTTTTTFNGRDQAESVTKTQTSPALSQVWTMTYDGHGRLKTQHRPEQIDTSNNPLSTTYNYNPDDSIKSVVDARGVTTNITYNSRGLTDTVSYTVPSGSNIPQTAATSFTYDDAGNRKKMTDGLGTVDYTYTELSQLKTEKRTFTDTLADAPAGGNAFELEYDYTLSGQLKHIKDPYGQQFNYTYDKVGRLQTVAGSTSFAGITTYANNPTYNARGTLTSLDYGNGIEMNLTGFNGKLQATGFEVKKGVNKYIDKEYDFYEDGSLKFIDDGLDQTFDRSYKYDHIGRTVEAKAGIAARGGSSTDQHKLDRPYTMTYSHDAFGHLTGKSGYYYSAQDITSYYYNANNRNPSWGYDLEGNIIYDDNAEYIYDAAGRVVETKQRKLDDSSQFDPPIKDYFSGDGQLLKKVRNAGSTDPAEITNYRIYSSVLNRIISETDKTGKKLKTFVTANGTIIAVQTLSTYNGNTTESLTFNHIDLSGMGVQETLPNGDLVGNTSWGRTGEYSPLGRNIADPGPYITLNTGPTVDEGGMILFDTGQGYRPGQQEFKVDGQTVSADEFMSLARMGALAIELINGRGQTVQFPVDVILNSIRFPTQVTQTTKFNPHYEGPPDDLYITKTTINSYGWFNFFAPPQGEQDNEDIGLDCPPPDSSQYDLWAAQALAHYIGGSGDPLTIPLAAVGATPPPPFDFGALLATYGNGKEGSYFIKNAHSNPIQTGNFWSGGGLQGAVLGRITFTLSGKLIVKQDGNFEFSGTIGVVPDRFDFTDDDKGEQSRGFPYDQSAWIGNQFPGKPYLIYIDGEFNVTYRSNPDGTISSSCTR